MGTLRMKLLVREAIRQALLEDDAARAGEALEAEERAAKEAYEKAVADLARWDAEEAKRVALINRAQELGIKLGDNKASKDLRKDPKYSYDAKVLQGKRETLVKKLEKAKDEYGAYDAAAVSYKRVASGGAKTPANMQMPDPKTKVYMPISEIKPLRWYSWSDPRWAKAVKNIAFGSSKEKSGDEQAGTGPGEERLAKIFGGKVQGGGVSFDVVTPDERRWEVKALETASTLIRPGTEGRAAFEKPRKQLQRIMIQIRNFSIITKKLGPDVADNQDDVAILKYISDFIDDEFEMFAKGEISPERFKGLRAVLKALSFLKKKWMSGEKPSDELTVGLADKKIPVDQPTFIDVAKRVQKSSPGVDVLSNFEEKEVACAALKDPAFENPTGFFNDWFETVDINRVFEQVDGVFIVNSKGFNMVPKPLFQKAFKFSQVSQLVPRFRFVFYASSEE